MDGTRTKNATSTATEGSQPYILLPRSADAAASHRPPRAVSNTAASSPRQTLAMRVEVIGASLREMRKLAAQSPASVSFSNFHSLLMLPDFPRPPLLPASHRIRNRAKGDNSAEQQFQQRHSQQDAHGMPHSSQLASTQPLMGPPPSFHAPAQQNPDPADAPGNVPHESGSRGALEAAQRATLPPAAQALMPPSIPHTLTPWEELLIRRDSADQQTQTQTQMQTQKPRPYRNVHLLAGKRKRRRGAHPSWADGGVRLPLISSRLLSKVEAALRMGVFKVDPERMVLGGAGFAVAAGQPGQEQVDEGQGGGGGAGPLPRGALVKEEEEARARWLEKRRRLNAGYDIASAYRPLPSSSASSTASDEVDNDVFDYVDRQARRCRVGSAAAAAFRAAAERYSGGDEPDSDAESVHESEADEWEVEIAHTICSLLPASTSSETVARWRLGKALAVPLRAHSTLLQVPLNEGERLAWNEEARQQRRIRLEAEATATAWER